MKYVLYGLLGILALLIAAVLIGPSFVDWNAYREFIAQEARRSTGRDMIIDGDISLAVLPTPALAVEKVRVANIQGGSKPTMAELSELRIRMALLPLLQGQFQVESVELVEPRILLEVLADGRRNWDLAAASGGPAARDEPASAGPEGGGLAGQVRIDNFSVTKGTLVYRDETSGFEQRIEGLDAQIVAEALTGPITARGRAMLRGVETGFDVAVGKILNGGATPLSLTFELPDSGARAKIVGSLSRHASDLRYRGGVTVEGDNLAAALRAVTARDRAFPALLRNKFSLETQLTGDLEQLAGEELRLQLGGNTLTGEVTIALGPQPAAKLTLGATRLDLDALLANPAAPGAAAKTAADGASDGAAEDPSGPPLFALPENLAAELELAVEGVIYRSQAVRQVRLGAALQDGRLVVDQAEAHLPGGSEFSLTAQVEQGEAGPRVDGLVSLTSDNLRGLAAWLGADLDSVPPDRLRRLSFEGVIQGDRQQISLRDIDLKVDLSQINGGIVAALRRRLGLGIGLAVDQLDLDAYLPGAEGVIAIPVPGGAAGDEDPAQGATAGAAAPGPLALLDAFDANIDLKLGKLTALGETARNLRATATLQGGSVTLRELSVSDLAGGRAHFTGVVSGVTGDPALDGAFELDVRDPLRLAKAFRLDAADLGRLGPFQLAGGLRGTRAQVAFDTELTALDGRFSFAGTLEPGGAPLAFDVEATANHPNLAGLAKDWNAPIAAGEGLGALDLKGRLVGTPLQVAVSDLIGKAGPLDLSGNMTADLSGPVAAFRDLDLNLALRHPELADLAEGLAGPLPVARELGPVDVTGRLTGSSEQPRLSDLAGSLGAVEISGEAGADLTGRRPALTAKLALGELPLAVLLVPLAGDEPDDGKANRRGVARWSRKPIDLSALDSLDADLDLTARALQLDRLALEDAVLRGLLRDGELKLESLSGKLAGGTVSLSGSLADGKPVKADLAVEAEGVDLQPLLKDESGAGRFAGPLDVKAELASRGATEAELISALSGEASFTGEITVAATPEDLGTAEPLSLPGGALGEIRGMSEAAAMLRGTFAETPGKLSGTLVVAEGIVTTEDARLDGQDGHALTSATLHLPQWRIRSRSDVFRSGDGDQPYLTLDLEGPLDEPNLRLSGLAFQPEPEPEPEPEAPDVEPEAVPEEESGQEIAPQPAPVMALDATEVPAAETEPQDVAGLDSPEEPAVEPEPEPQPVSQPAPEPELEPQVEVVSEPTPEPLPEPEVAAAPEPETQSAPEPEPEALATPEPEEITEARLAEEPAPEPEAAPDPGPEAAAAPVEKPVPEPETLTEVPVVDEPAAEPDVSPEPETVTEARLEQETATEPEEDMSLPAETEPVGVAETGLPLPKRKPAFLAELAKTLPAAEAEPASEDAILKDLVSKVLDGLKAPQKTAPEPEPEPQPTETGTTGFVGKILDKLKN